MTHHSDHDSRCEARDPEYMTSACRCAERKARPMGERQSIRDEIGHVIREYMPGADGVADSATIADALLASPVIRRIQAEAYDQGGARSLDKSGCVCWDQDHQVKHPEMHWRNPYREAKW